MRKYKLLQIDHFTPCSYPKLSQRGIQHELQTISQKNIILEEIRDDLKFLTVCNEMSR